MRKDVDDAEEAELLAPVEDQGTECAQEESEGASGRVDLSTCFLVQLLMLLMMMALRLALVVPPLLL